MRVGAKEYIKQLVYSIVSRNKYLKNLTKRLYSRMVEKRSNEAQNTVFKDNDNAIKITFAIAIITYVILFIYYKSIKKGSEKNE